MLKKLNDKDRKRLHRKIHIRKRIFGTAERPRMTVTRSNKNLYVQMTRERRLLRFPLWKKNLRLLNRRLKMLKN